MEKLLFWSETSKILIYLENIGWDFSTEWKEARCTHSPEF